MKKTVATFCSLLSGIYFFCDPCYTTKPSGQRAGLGLYLKFDIVKAHGGNMTVPPPGRLGSEIIIHLPFKII